MNGPGTGGAYTYLLDGLIFRNGLSAYGGAIGPSMSISSITITDCLFQNNHADNMGGAICFLDNGDLIIFNTSFQGNSATSDGGAIYTDSANSLSIANTLMVGNTADSGGAIFHDSTGFDTDYIINTTFSGNNSAGGDGGACYFRDMFEIYIYNTIFFANTAGFAPSVWLENSPSIDIQYTCMDINEIENNSGQIGAAIPGLSTTDVNNYNPLLTATFRLSSSSNARNAGLDSLYLVQVNGWGVDTYSDMDGKNRIKSGTIDLGPFEDY
jgi:predicted outer membrane repeat protein